MEAEFPQIAVNLCQEHLDATDTFMHAEGVDSRAHQALESAGFFNIQPSRVYIGSYYCEHLFLALSNARVRAFEAYCARTGARASLVIPLCGESTVNRIVSLAESLIADHPFIDEVVVNDLGMLAHFANAFEKAPFAPDRPAPAIMLGRLWHKEVRDPRYAALMEKAHVIHEPAALPYSAATAGFEIDPIGHTIDLSHAPEQKICALHIPYCHLSIGRICAAQSRDEDPSRKFLPGAPCGLECMESFTWFNVETFPDPLEQEDAPYESLGETPILRKGRAVVFRNDQCQWSGGAPDRLIVAPRFAFDESEAIDD